MDLRHAILHAEPGIRVDQVVADEILARLPPKLRKQLAGKTIAWAEDRRIWGLSFTLHDRTITVGHRRGDHLAQHPEAHGLTNEVAEDLLRRHIEGVILHELGHLVLDLAQQHLPDFPGDFVRQSTAWAPPSTYAGYQLDEDPGKELSAFDAFHEQFAEAFRWWIMAPDYATYHFPAWSILCKMALDTLR